MLVAMNLSETHKNDKAGGLLRALYDKKPKYLLRIHFHITKNLAQELNLANSFQ